jgi:hypothetical protein
MALLPETERERPEVGKQNRLRAYGVTPRAVVVGSLLVPLLCFWTLYSEIVAQSTELAVMSLSVGAVFALLLLLLLNAVFKRFLPRLAMSQAELLFIYLMQTTSLAISGVGMMQFLHIGLANIFWYASPENGWEDFHPELRPWAFPDPRHLRAYYLGQSSFFTREHLLAWLSPILVWSAFLLVLFGVMFCLNVLLRRRWVEQERLTFPITALPLEMTREGGNRAFFTNKGMWAGFLLAFVLQALAGVAYLFPSLPFVPIKPSDPRLSLSFESAASPWNAVGSLELGFYPMVIGLTYLLPLDVSFSCWFFFLLRKLEDVGATALGYRDPGASNALARIPYYGEQGLGAFLGLALFSLWGMRGYLKGVFRTLSRSGRVKRNDLNEPLSYPIALAGVFGGGLLLILFAVSLGMAAQLAILFFVLYILVVITYTRIRAEAGLPWAFGPDMTPHQLIVAAQGTHTLGTQNMVALTQFQWMDLDYRCTLMPHQLEAMKLAGEARMRQRHLFGVVLLATVLGILASWVGILAIYYKYGAATAHVDAWRTSMGNPPWQILSGWVYSPTDFDLPRLEGVGAGIGITGLLMACRARFLWWPFHPIGYALAGGFTLVWLWSPILMGWCIKLCLLRFGGMKIYRAFLPFFIGLILGDYVAGSLWAILGSATGIQTYKVMPI